MTESRGCFSNPNREAATTDCFQTNQPHTKECTCFYSPSSPSGMPEYLTCEQCLTKGYYWKEQCVLSNTIPNTKTSPCQCSTSPISIPGYTCTFSCNVSGYSTCSTCTYAGGICTTSCKAN